MSIVKNLLEHNEHYVELNIFGKTVKPCARCFGKILGMMVSTPIALLFFLGYLHIDFIAGFTISWLLALPAILDWSSVKLKLREGNNHMRVLTGFLLGCGIVSYFLIMPATWLFKFGTFLIYETVFGIIYIHSKYGITSFINTIKAKPMIYGCEVGGTCCCGNCCDCCNGCYGGCINAMICMVLACFTIPLCLCLPKIMKK